MEDFNALTSQLISQQINKLYDFQIFGVLSFDSIKEMLLDPQIIAALNVIKLPLIQNDWDVECESTKIADFLREALQPLWTRLLQNTLTGLEFGFSGKTYSTFPRGIESVPHRPQNKNQSPKVRPIRHSHGELKDLHSVWDIVDRRRLVRPIRHSHGELKEQTGFIPHL